MAASIRAGEVLAGRYRMVDLLAEAEGGWFWRAHDEILERTVAIHLIASDDSRAVDLMDAARRSARLDDRRNLRVLDADVTDTLCYVVNEWGQGKSLDLALTTDGPLTPARSAWVVAEVADTIATAHAAGVTHDQLLPEHVLLDENGQVRVIGMAVDAALHGLPAHRQEEDVTHLAALLYACLTARWPGPGESVVLPPPRESGKLLRPRQVRAGIPRALDQICEEMLLGATPPSRSLGLGVMLGQRSDHDLTTAAGVREALEGFLGEPSDPNGHGPGAALRTETPRMTPPYALSPEQRVAAGLSPELSWAPGDVAETDFDAGSALGESASEESDESTPASAGPTGTDGAVGPDIPTEAGMPVFHEGDEDVEWLRARAHKPAPPPDFETPEERPLFAPTPGEGVPLRRARPGRTVQDPGHGDDYWPWDTSTGRDSDTTNGSGGLPVVSEPIPGRSWLRLAWIIGVAALLLLTMVAAWQLGTGRTSNQDPGDESRSNSTRQSPSGEALEIEATDFDPEGNPPEEYPEDAPKAVDGDPETVWSTQTYAQQFGDEGLKRGVGLVLDLGEARDVRQLQITVVGGETAAQVFVTDDAPESVDQLEPVGASAGEDILTVTLDDTVKGRYVTVWLTKVPKIDGKFRGGVAEVEVFG